MADVDLIALGLQVYYLGRQFVAHQFYIEIIWKCYHSRNRTTSRSSRARLIRRWLLHSRFYQWPI
jgi:hypothetical protein